MDAFTSTFTFGAVVPTTAKADVLAEGELQEIAVPVDQESRPCNGSACVIA